MNPISVRDHAFEGFEGNLEGGFEIHDQASMEKFMLRSERGDGLGKRLLVKALGLFVYIPELTFDKEDVDMKIVNRMLRHPELLKVIDDWISVPDQNLLPKLQEAMRVFGPMQKKTNHGKLFRGFNPKSVDQDTMGLQRRGWMGPKPADFRVGDKFSYVTQRALSFTHHEGTASVFGGVVISIDQNRYRNQLLEICPELCYAIGEADPDYAGADVPYYVTYGELILLPNKKPVEFQVVSVGKKK